MENQTKTETKHVAWKNRVEEIIAINAYVKTNGQDKQPTITIQGTGLKITRRWEERETRQESEINMQHVAATRTIERSTKLEVGFIFSKDKLKILS